MAATLSLRVAGDDRLDRAVWAAYGWPDPPTEADVETIPTWLLALNLEHLSVN